MNIIINGEAFRNHSNGGGWVSETAIVDEAVYVSPLSIIHSGVEIRGSVRIEGNVQVIQNESQLSLFTRVPKIKGNGIITGVPILDSEEAPEFLLVSPLSEHIVESM